MWLARASNATKDHCAKVMMLKASAAWFTVIGAAIAALRDLCASQSCRVGAAGGGSWRAVTQLRTS